ncbi:MAG TPA: arsenate reductase ArsC [Actinomycetota bacterium]|nr:arsenate reductase ArsC [Actinomycetota bacterium]
MTQRPRIVFLCVHNAGRSQMAAAWATRLGGDGVEVYSGGSDPAAAVHPVVLDAMREVGIDLTDRVPARWTDTVVAEADVVVTMGCGDACPVFPGVRYVDWQLPDPAGQPIERVRPIRDDLRGRVAALLADLGVVVRVP